MEINLDVERLEKKLSSLKDTQEAITGLSKWCLSKRSAHKQIVRSWLNVLKKGSSYFYLEFFCKFQIHFSEN